MVLYGSQYEYNRNHDRFSSSRRCLLLSEGNISFWISRIFSSNGKMLLRDSRWCQFGTFSGSVFDFCFQCVDRFSLSLIYDYIEINPACNDFSRLVSPLKHGVAWSQLLSPCAFMALLGAFWVVSSVPSQTTMASFLQRRQWRFKDGNGAFFLCERRQRRRPWAVGLVVLSAEENGHLRQCRRSSTMATMDGAPSFDDCVQPFRWFWSWLDALDVEFDCVNASNSIVSA